MRSKVELFLFFLLVLLALAVVFLTLSLVVDAQAESQRSTVFLPVVRSWGICTVDVLEDGTWTSPDYNIGEPFPPPCKWVPRYMPEGTSWPVCIYEDGSWSQRCPCPDPANANMWHWSDVIGWWRGFILP